MEVKMMVFPRRGDYLKAAARYGVVPVWVDVAVDLKTPISIFKKVASGDYSYLLESVEGGEQVARYSFIGFDPFLIYKSKGEQLEVTAHGRRRQLTGDPLGYLKEMMAALKVAPLPGEQRFQGGAVGYFGYDLVRHFDPLPEIAKDDLHLPDCFFILTRVVLIYDHVTNRLRVVALIPIEGDPQGAYEQSMAAVQGVIERLEDVLPEKSVSPGYCLSGSGGLNQPHGVLPEKRAAVMQPRIAQGVEQLQSKLSSGDAISDVASQLSFTPVPDMTREEYLEKVCCAKEYISAGDVQQVVLSQRFQCRTSSETLAIYRMLRSLNPSPYMYYLNFGDLCLIGSSPEMLVRVENGMAETHPIAGTRRRGGSAAGDQVLAKDLLADPKERAEHEMLIALSRGDLNQVCEKGTIDVSRLMDVEYYSHVMHLVSHVRGRLAPGQDAFNALRACFPAGTVSGAPRRRALEIIEELEPVRRGPYAGAVGYLSFNGNLDSCLIIRTIVIKNGIAYVQAGAGIVAGSVPEREYEECVSKVEAMLKALELAEGSGNLDAGTAVTTVRKGEDRMRLQDLIDKVVNQYHLEEKEAEEAMAQIMSGEATSAQIAALITALRLKGETVDEITGFARAMRAHGKKIRVNKRLVDIVGTGGDRSFTFNISTTTAFVAAAAGLPVAKHGNRAVSSKCGSADVLEALGVNMALTPAQVERCLEENGICFLFAPVFHEAMKHAVGPRREIGIRTVFNLLGPLTNPADAKVQLVGVYHPHLTGVMARVLRSLGVERAMVVHGDGLDEISHTGETRVSELMGGEIRTYYLSPEDIGLKRGKLADICGGNAEDNARMTRDVLSGKPGPCRDVVLMNAAAALFVGGKVESLREGVELAAQVIDSGAALRKLEDLVAFTKSCA
jgi:anthranilate synthase component 1